MGDYFHITAQKKILRSKDEEIAVKEANKLSIPVVALVDTNCDPDRVNYVIPGNDDAIKSIKLVINLLTESVMAGRKQFSVPEVELPGKSNKHHRSESRLSPVNF